MAEAIVEHAPAKVNLALHVTGRRPDGYHLLETLAVFTRSGDRITVRSATSDSFSIGGPFAAVLGSEQDNLVLRARDLLRGLVADAATPPVAIILEKNLPVASGIGGGSSDAAATLRALTRQWGLTIPRREMAAATLSLGADLPMCLAARSLIARGIGDRITTADGLPELPLVLVNPGVAVSTPAIFRALRSCDSPPLPEQPARPDFDALVDWLGHTRNDLQAPAILGAPAIDDALSKLRDSGAALARMSGSGATCFGLFASPGNATRAAAAIAEARPSWYVRATRTIERVEADVAD